MTVDLSVSFKKLLESVLGRDREFLTSVTTASGKDPASVGRAHTLAKAMLVDSLAV